MNLIASSMFLFLQKPRTACWRKRIEAVRGFRRRERWGKCIKKGGTSSQKTNTKKVKQNYTKTSSWQEGGWAYTGTKSTKSSLAQNLPTFPSSYDPRAQDVGHRVPAGTSVPWQVPYLDKTEEVTVLPSLGVVKELRSQLRVGDCSYLHLPPGYCTQLKLLHYHEIYSIHRPSFANILSKTNCIPTKFSLLMLFPFRTADIHLHQ